MFSVNIVSIPDKSDLALSLGLLKLIPKIFLCFSFPYPIPIIKGTLLPELSSYISIPIISLLKNLSVTSHLVYNPIFNLLLWHTNWPLFSTNWHLFSSPPSSPGPSFYDPAPSMRSLWQFVPLYRLMLILPFSHRSVKSRAKRCHAVASGWTQSKHGGKVFSLTQVTAWVLFCKNNYWSRNWQTLPPKSVSSCLHRCPWTWTWSLICFKKHDSDHVNSLLWSLRLVISAVLEAHGTILIAQMKKVLSNVSRSTRLAQGESWFRSAQNEDDLSTIT